MEIDFKDKIQFFKIKIKFYLKNPKKLTRWLYENLQTTTGLEKPDSVLQIILNFLNPLPELYLLIYDLKIKARIKSKRKIILTAEKVRIFPVYFSCRRDFKYLILSLKSLAKLNSEYIHKVYLYIDKKDFLSEEEITKLKGITLLSIVLRKTKYRMTWGGQKLLINELTAFNEINGEISDKDYIVKVDSDILFVSDKIFKDVVETNYDLIGRVSALAISLNTIFVSGACYFLRNSIITVITNYPIYRVVKKTSKMLARGIINLPEDSMVYNLVKTHTDSIRIDPLIGGYYLHYLQIEKGVTAEEKKSCCVIHFSSAKDRMNKMLEYAKKSGIL